MRRPVWQRLGLSQDEWHDCRLAALEMSLSSGARVPPRQVAVEFALARAFAEPALALRPGEADAASRGGLSSAARPLRGSAP